MNLINKYKINQKVLVSFCIFCLVVLLNWIIFLSFRTDRSVQTEASSEYSDVLIQRNVMVINFDLVLESQDGRKLTDYYNWNTSESLEKEIIDFFREITNQRVIYQKVVQYDLNEYLEKQSGYVYNEESYMACQSNQGSCHETDIINYEKFLTEFEICEKANENNVDEVWMFGGPWFGFYESTLVGSLAFDYNSPPIKSIDCGKLLPIMGFSFEREYDLAIHNYGHRLEDTMRKVYGKWNRSNPSNNWDFFAAVDFKTKLGKSGCGDTHFPANAIKDYEYDNYTFIDSYCDEFFEYPDVGDDLERINCENWGCSHEGYMQWWFTRLPNKKGYGTDGKLNDWWLYLIDPNIVLTNQVPSDWPRYVVPTVTPTPTPASTSIPVGSVTSVPTSSGVTWTSSPTIIPVATNIVASNYTGDYDGDGLVTVSDFIVFKHYYNQGDMRSDLNRDGVVQDVTDFLEFKNQLELSNELGS